MKTIVFALLLSGCGTMGLVGPDCSDADYMTGWNICVYTAPDGTFSKKEVEYNFDLFFEGFAYFENRDVSDEMRQYYKKTTTSMTFVQYPFLLTGQDWKTTGMAQNTYNDSSERNAITITEEKIMHQTKFAHELMHTIQYAEKLVHDDIHAYPVDWFIDYDVNTGDAYPGQDWNSKLENKLAMFITCIVEPEVMATIALCKDLVPPQDRP